MIVASNGGAATSPVWYHNLMARPEFTVEFGAATFTVAVRDLGWTLREASIYGDTPDALNQCPGRHTPDGSGRSSAPSSEERQNDVARLSLPADPHVEGNAAPFSTIGEAEALRKETRLVRTSSVRDRHAPLAWRPWVLLHHVGTRISSDRHGHRGSRIDNGRELVPGEFSVSTRVGRIHGRQEARLREIPRAESEVIWPDGGQSTAGELRRFLVTGEDLGVRRSADDSGRTAGI